MNGTERRTDDMARRTNEANRAAAASGGRVIRRARARAVPRPRDLADGARRLALGAAGLLALAAVALAFRPMPAALAADGDASAAPADAATATFAGGCFWCMEPPFDKTEGVYSTTSGYMGGEQENPTYEQVAAGRTEHAEVVQVKYDPEVVDYATLLDVFWRNVDPLTANRQFCDRGAQYRSAIFVHGEEQRSLAEASLAELEESGRFDDPIVTELAEAGDFWPAEAYHQDYYKKNPFRYKFYRNGCGRDDRLEKLWGSDA